MYIFILVGKTVNENTLSAWVKAIRESIDIRKESIMSRLEEK
ncbi:hypothetical protein [Wolbachia endosymbiont of Folsomia candida]|nr:hypothetical protein [Wolbachia endosymbiont of Folsomia candida]